MAADAGDEIGLQPGRFPFTMVLGSLLVRGMLFACLNGPLVWLCFQNPRPTTVRDLLAAVLSLAKRVVSHDLSAPLLTVMLLTTILIGFALMPVQSVVLYLVQGLAAAIYRLWRTLEPILHRRQPRPRHSPSAPPFFAANIYAENEYIPLMSWLFRNPHAKGHWEWQLFHNYLYWSLAANTTIFAILVLTLVADLSFAECLGVCAVPGVFCLSALYHSDHMARVHRFYIAKAGLTGGADIRDGLHPPDKASAGDSAPAI